MFLCFYLQACDLLEGLIPTKEDKSQLPRNHMEKLFIFAIMWSMGALLELDDRAKLEQFMLKHESGFSYPTVQSDETIFEYVVDSSGTYFFKYCCCLTVRHKWVPEIIDFLLEKRMLILFYVCLYVHHLGFYTQRHIQSNMKPSVVITTFFIDN